MVERVDSASEGPKKVCNSVASFSTSLVKGATLVKMESDMNGINGDELAIVVALPCPLVKAKQPVPLKTRLKLVDDSLHMVKSPNLFVALFIMADEDVRMKKVRITFEDGDVINENDGLLLDIPLLEDDMIITRQQKKDIKRAKRSMRPRGDL